MMNSFEKRSRSEMKMVMAGAAGNIHCNAHGVQYICPVGDLEYCTDDCADTHGDQCAGCAEFPEIHP